jgi:hypothetical protein
MEVPFLACSSILSLDDKISSKIVNVSTSSESRDDIEVFVDNQTIFSVPFTSSWFSLPVLSVDEVPLLVSLTMEFGHVDISIFGISTT